MLTSLVFTTAHQIRENKCKTKFETYPLFWTKILCAPARFAIASVEWETLQPNHPRHIAYPVKNKEDAAGDLRQIEN